MLGKTQLGCNEVKNINIDWNKERWIFSEIDYLESPTSNVYNLLLRTKLKRIVQEMVHKICLLNSTNNFFVFQIIKALRQR